MSGFARRLQQGVSTQSGGQSPSGYNYLLNPSSYTAPDGLAYPDATNAGFTAYYDSTLGRKLQASDLTVYNGTFNTSSTGQIIEKMDIYGQVKVKHNGVIFRGCRITTENTSTPNLIFGVTDHNMSLTANWTMEYCTLHAIPTYNEVTMLNHEWGNVTWCDISGGTDGWDPWGLNNLTFEHNYIHDLTPYGGAHSDCIQSVGGAGPCYIRYNTLLSTNPSYPIGVYNTTKDSGQQFPGNTSGMQIGQLTGDIGYAGDLYFEDNLCDGGNYMFNANWAADGTHDLVGTIYIRNNRYGRDEQYGLYTHINDGAHNVVISGNVYDDDGSSA